VEYVSHRGIIDDFSFDKKGYMHGHFNVTFYQPGVGRYDPDQATRQPGLPGGESDCLRHLTFVRYNEVPYDYGEVPNKKDHLGVLPVKDQANCRAFQDGVGVNMRGDVAECCNIWYIPKMGDVQDFNTPDNLAKGKAGCWIRSYADLLRELQDLEKRGEQMFFIPRRPGLGLDYGTIWTFNSNGEVRDKCAVLSGNFLNGVQMDEEGDLYFTMRWQRWRDGNVFLAGRAGVFGREPRHESFVGTFIKSAGNNVKVLMDRGATVPMDEKPARPPEVAFHGTPPTLCWVEGAKWLYAGASPIKESGCNCPQMRACLDWYKRSFVPEAYRHSIGVLDTNGNLILHIGRYGNLDSGDGAKSRIPVGGDNIAMSFCENVAVTDNYLCYDDFCERVAVLKLNYYAVETAGIAAGK